MEPMSWSRWRLKNTTRLRNVNHLKTYIQIPKMSLYLEKAYMQSNDLRDIACVS